MLQMYISTVQCCSYGLLGDIKNRKVTHHYMQVPYEEERRGPLNPLLHLIVPKIKPATVTKFSVLDKQYSFPMSAQ